MTCIDDVLIVEQAIASLASKLEYGVPQLKSVLENNLELVKQIGTLAISHRVHVAKGVASG